jgi:hypothetical protein
MGKNTIKRVIQVNGHSLKLHLCMFDKSQMKHNSLDCQNVFWNIFHQLQILHAKSLTQINFFLHVQSTQTSKMDNPWFFQTSVFLLSVHHYF